MAPQTGVGHGRHSGIYSFISQSEMLIILEVVILKRKRDYTLVQTKSGKSIEEESISYIQCDPYQTGLPWEKPHYLNDLNDFF